MGAPRKFKAVRDPNREIVSSSAAVMSVSGTVISVGTVGL